MRRWDGWAIGFSTAATVGWLAISGTIVRDSCGWASALRCAPPNEIGDFVGGMTAPLALIWLLCAVAVQASQLAEQRKEVHAMQEQSLNKEAKAAFDAAAEVLAHRLVVNDSAWLVEWKGATIQFDRRAYEADDDRLTIMKAEAELQRQLKAYLTVCDYPDRPSFLQKDPEAFLEIRAALQRAAALAKDVPASYRPMVAEMNLERFMENVETITKGSYVFVNDERFAGMNLPSWLNERPAPPPEDEDEGGPPSSRPAGTPGRSPRR